MIYNNKIPTFQDDNKNVIHNKPTNKVKKQIEIDNVNVKNWKAFHKSCLYRKVTGRNSQFQLYKTYCTHFPTSHAENVK